MNAPALDSLNPATQASFEKGFNPDHFDQFGADDQKINGIGLVLFVEAPTPEWGDGFCVFFVGARQHPDEDKKQQVNGLVQGFAVRARMGLYDAGFTSPENRLNDFPAATFLLSQDIACSQIALQPGKMNRDNALRALQETLIEQGSVVFGGLRAHSQAMNSMLRSHKAFDALANETVARLRSRIKNK